ncbi:PREDICTED: centromere protein O-like [Acropora digitifera]|uniref:centromere protein O-like n=1 Tax=Acropora digitifera TaxID=70779 RepID=UPI00077A876B|nr:PREDICTED: centromere protein O-like [Acropora digitifera]
MADKLADEGPLYDLERLQQRADRRNGEFEASRQEKSGLATLHSKVEQLRNRRDKLCERLNRGPEKILKGYLKKEKVDDVLNNQKQPMKSWQLYKYIITALPECCIDKNILMLKEYVHLLLDLCDAYRLTGISIASQEDSSTCFRCDTFFNARYHEPYYIEVDLEDSNLKIHKHTVPFFIPIDSIAQNYLNTDIKKFFMVLSEHLNAFVARREQVQLCQENHKDRLQNGISCSPAHDYVHFKTKVK